MADDMDVDAGRLLGDTGWTRSASQPSALADGADSRKLGHQEFI